MSVSFKATAISQILNNFLFLLNFCSLAIHLPSDHCASCQRTLLKQPPIFRTFKPEQVPAPSRLLLRLDWALQKFDLILHWQQPKQMIFNPAKRCFLRVKLWVEVPDLQHTQKRFRTFVPINCLARWKKSTLLNSSMVTLSSTKIKLFNNVYIYNQIIKTLFKQWHLKSLYSLKLVLRIAKYWLYPVLGDVDIDQIDGTPQCIREKC